jgi:lipopolysaccharide/colanic/teichoic acid biosynthesis glycosyltransferase
VRDTVTTCEELGVTFRLRYSDLKKSLSSAIRTTFANGNFLSFVNVPYHSYALAIRKTMDINMSLLMIVFLSPFFIIIAVLLRLTSNGPIIIKQEGVGWKGRPIMLFRFRANIEYAGKKNISQEYQKASGSQNSDIEESMRVTKIGKFLVNSGLDQLPQLFNVLKGDMPIFGFQSPLQSDKLQMSDFK